MASSPSSMDETRKSADPPKEPNGRVCTVCSDRANGYNFGVLTCESCKAFFRRNAAKHKEIKCPFSDSCQITSASRKFCQACRLNKCFTVGMNSEWLNDIKPKIAASGTGKFKRKKMKNQLKMEVIDTEEDIENEEEEQVSVPKALLEKLISKANEVPKDHCICKCQCGFYPSTQKLTALIPKEELPQKSPPDTSVTQSIHNPEPYSSSSTSTLSPMSVISCTPSSYDSNYSTPQLVTHSPSNYRISPSSMAGSIAEMSPQMPHHYPPIVSPFQFGMMTQKTSPPSFLSFPPMPERTWTPVQAIPVPIVENILPPASLLEKIHTKIDKYIGVLNDDEMGLLQELHIQNEPLNAPLMQWHDPKNIDGVFKIIEEALKRIVNMACQLNLFRELHVEDRKNLLKSGFGELLIVRGLMAYDRSDNSWNHSFGVGGKMEVKVDVLKNPKLEEHYKAHLNLLATFGEDVRNNEHLMLIFNAAVIFHPHVSNLRESNRVHTTQAKYFQMLLKLLTFEYGKPRADIAYSNLLNQVVELHRVNRTLLRVFYGLDISQLDPLIRELCSFE